MPKVLFHSYAVWFNTRLDLRTKAKLIYFQGKANIQWKITLLKAYGKRGKLFWVQQSRGFSEQVCLIGLHLTCNASLSCVSFITILFISIFIISMPCMESPSIHSLNNKVLAVLDICLLQQAVHKYMESDAICEQNFYQFCTWCFKHLNF